MNTSFPQEAAFKKLEVWQLAHELTLLAYKLTADFPASEKFRLSDQLCRAASSVPANISEAQGRYQTQDQIQFLIIARGSLNETRYFLTLAHDLGFLKESDFTKSDQLAAKTSAKLNAFIQSKRKFKERAAPSLVGRRAPSFERETAFRGFTLIELLTTMAIVLVLSGMLVVGIRYAQRNAMVSRTQAEVEMISAAIEAFKADHGVYPPYDLGDTASTPLDQGGFDFRMRTNFPSAPKTGNADGWDNTEWLYSALCPTNGNKIYIKLTQNQISQPAGPGQPIYIVDPNGRPYGYNPRTPIGNPGGFDFFSAGPDGISSYSSATIFSSTNDDIGNWQRR